MTNDEDENLLVLLVQSGDIAAFERLLLRLYQPLRNYVSKLVGVSTAEDVLQEVALRIFQNIKSLREPRAFRPWVFRIATRIAFVHLKRDKRWRASETDPQAFAAISGNIPNEPEEVATGLLGMVDRLSPASRAVLLLHYQQNLSLDETAAILDIPVGTAKSRLSYGVAKLRDFMKEKETK